MTLTVLDPKTGHRVVITVPPRQRVSERARRWVIRELDNAPRA
jgi:hypothetical protein